MNYKESKQVLEKIKKAKRILTSCHRSPDADSVASCLVLQKALTQLGKNVHIISPDTISDNYVFIGDVKKIQVVNDMANFKYSDYDMFFVLDSSTWSQIRLDESPNIPIINIDHHPKSIKKNALNIVDLDASSTTEILYFLFKDFGLKIAKDIAQQVLTGVDYDTNFFTNSNTASRSHKVASELIENGADNYSIVFNMDYSLELNQVYLWREYLNNFELDELGFTWSAIPFTAYSKYPTTRSVTTTVTEGILKKVKGVKFAMAMCENKPGHLQVSFRSRELTFNVLKIAHDLGGGGHEVAAGASVDGLPYKEAVEKVLQVARKYAKES